MQCSAGRNFYLTHKPPQVIRMHVIGWWIVWKVSSECTHECMECTVMHHRIFFCNCWMRMLFIERCPDNYNTKNCTCTSLRACPIKSQADLYRSKDLPSHPFYLFWQTLLFKHFMYFEYSVLWSTVLPMKSTIVTLASIEFFARLSYSVTGSHADELCLILPGTQRKLL